jgi:cyclin-dependent kinase 8/11
MSALPSSVASRYEAHDVIGMGAYALRVYHATAVDDGAEVALKQAKAIKDGVGVTMDAYRELKLLREMSLAPHPNIVPLREFVLPTSDNTSDMFTVFDYSEYDLTDIIKHHKQAQKNINMALIRHFMHQLLSALGHLHEHWIVHRDVKPQNCLVSRSGCLQLADFGLARSFRAPLRRIGDDGDVCTLWYRAPELLFGAKTYTRAIDIFSAGCIFAELIGTEAAFRATERANATFQDEQVKKLFSVLGFPTEAQLAAFKSLPHFSRISSWKAPSYVVIFVLFLPLPRILWVHQKLHGSRLGRAFGFGRHIHVMDLVFKFLDTLLHRRLGLVFHSHHRFLDSSFGGACFFLAAHLLAHVVAVSQNAH